MASLLWLAAGVALFAAGLAYFRGGFHLAAALGVAYWSLAGAVLWRTLPPPASVPLLVALVAVPAVLLALHAIDARRGLFLVPTIYAIPLAFLTGLLLWIVAAGACAFAAAG